MPQEREEMGLQAMLEESRHIQQRVTTVETTVVEHERRLSVVEFAQTDLKTIVGKLTDIQVEQGKKTALNEAAILAIKERTDILSDHMEKATDRLTIKQDDTGTKVSRLETKMGVIQAVALAALGILLTILAQHFVHVPV